MEFVMTILEGAWRYVTTIRIADYLDIALMAYCCYLLLRLVRSTRAESLVKGIMVFLLALWISHVFKLNGIYFILNHMLDVGILALIVLFQPEIRRILEQVGSSKLRSFIPFAAKQQSSAIENAIAQTVLACTEMSKTRTGVLIVFEREMALDDIARERKLTPEERQEQKKYAKLADAFTPLAKGMNSEYANQNAYDSIQIHGGSGFMLEYACQRIYRDARITSIYEGTTQLQTVAAIRYVTNGSYSATLRDYEQVPCSEEMQPLMDRIKEMTNKFEACTNAVKEAQNQELLDFVARRLYEMAAVCIMSHLIIQDATKAPELFGKSALVYVNYAEAEVEKHFNFIRKFKAEELESYRK